jgi:iduronate 2-sulfatase
MKSLLAFVYISCGVAALSASAFAEESNYNVLFIISDDLTSTALSCYGSNACATPNIDRIAARGTRFTHAYCQGTYCGPSRASFMSGYYPHATGVLGYVSPRPMIGDRATWAQHFKNAGYYTARVSKIFHMSVPGGIEKGDDGADDPISWTESIAKGRNGRL